MSKNQERKPSLSQILADPRNTAVSQQFFRFALMLFVLPIGILTLLIQTGLVSVQIAGIAAVLLVNVIMGVYAYRACKEDVQDWKSNLSEGKRDS